MQSAMKTVIVLLLCTIATSFIHSGIIRCAVNKRHYTIPFVTRNERELYEKLLQSKDDTINILAKSKDEMVKSKDEMLSAANSEILYLQGRLSLRSVFEQFEQRYEGLLDTSISTKGITRREKLWKAIIETNAGGIKQYLGDTTTDWPSVAQSLYKLISKDVHNFTSKKVIINDISLSREMTNLAVTVCTMYPIKYKIISPSSFGQEKSINNKLGRRHLVKKNQSINNKLGSYNLCSHQCMNGI